MTLYDNIKKRRKELGLTQTELAERVGYADKSAIGHIEKGKIDLPQSKIVAIAKALQTTPGDLMGSTPEDKEIDMLFEKIKQLTVEQRETIAKIVDSFLKSDNNYK